MDLEKFAIYMGLAVALGICFKFAPQGVDFVAGFGLFWLIVHMALVAAGRSG